MMTGYRGGCFLKFKRWGSQNNLGVTSRYLGRRITRDIESELGYPTWGISEYHLQVYAQQTVYIAHLTLIQMSGVWELESWCVYWALNICTPMSFWWRTALSLNNNNHHYDNIYDNGDYNSKVITNCWCNVLIRIILIIIQVILIWKLSHQCGKSLVGVSINIRLLVLSKFGK